jgi:hypothetical protein
MEHRDTLEILWLPDKSAALLVRRYDGQNQDAVRLVQLSKGRVTRITDLHKLLDELLTADYREHAVKGAKSAPALRHRFEDWWFVGSDRVAVECQATAEFDDPADAEAAWGARLDAIWSIQEARWLRQEIKRYSFGDK